MGKKGGKKLHELYPDLASKNAKRIHELYPDLAKNNYFKYLLPWIENNKDKWIKTCSENGRKGYRDKEKIRQSVLKYLEEHYNEFLIKIKSYHKKHHEEFLKAIYERDRKITHEQRSERAMKGQETRRKHIEEGKINPFCSKEEELCYQEILKYLKIKFPYIKLDKPIFIDNPYPETIGKNAICKFHPYDFGSKKLKLLIEYDGYVHWKDDEFKVRDEYWNEVAKNLGYFIIRIDSRKWRDTLYKQNYLLEIEQYIENKIGGKVKC